MSENDGQNGPDSYNTYSVDDEDQLQAEDTLVDRGVNDALDEGYTAPERWSPGEGYGNTPLEEQLGETLEQRIAQEVPEADPYEQAKTETDTEDVGGEVGDERAGRLVAEDDRLVTDFEKDMVADEVGIDGGAASAEEAAVHVLDDE